MASTKLSDRKIRAVIQCYAEQVLPQAAARICRLSYPTVHQLYGYIRERMCHVGLYRSQEEFERDQDEAEEKGPYFDWQGYYAYLKEGLGKHRGIAPHKRGFYVAEQIFHFENEFTPGQHYHLILLAIGATGPLNRPPRHFDNGRFYREVFRIYLSGLRIGISSLGFDAPVNDRFKKDFERFEVMLDLMLSEMDSLSSSGRHSPRNFKRSRVRKKRRK